MISASSRYYVSQKAGSIWLVILTSQVALPGLVASYIRIVSQCSKERHAATYWSAHVDTHPGEVAFGKISEYSTDSGLFLKDDLVSLSVK